MTRVVLRHPSTGRPLDEALVVFFEEGASYTGEESVELHCHGGPALLRGVLDACIQAGARPAAPGEFTRRALASGRIDLLQAEAIALLVEAEREEAVALGLDALSGRPSGAVLDLADRLTDCLAECEAALDFPEDVEWDPEGLRRRMEDAAAETGRWLQAARSARAVLTRFKVALVGPPNAGKSSIFNALLGHPRAIVHPEPGTTRDVVSESLVLGGVPCELLDTAGLRDATTEVEAEGVTRAMNAASDAECVVLVLDGTAPVPKSLDISPDIVVVNKADIFGGVPVFDLPPGAMVTSAKDGRGIAELRAAIGAKASAAMAAGSVADCVVFGERQEQAVADARFRLLSAVEGMRQGAPMEVIAAEMRFALERLLEVTGRVVSEAVLDRVFQRFCVGK